MSKEKKDLEIVESEQEARESAYALTGELGEIYQKYGKKVGVEVERGIMEYIKGKMAYWRKDNAY